MKKLIVVVALLAVAVVVYAGVARIDDYSGSLTATAYNAVRAGTVSSGDILLASATQNSKYSGLRGYVYVGAAVVSPLDADSLEGVEGANDTAIVTVKSYTGYDEDVIFCDTCADALPCTLFFNYWEDISGNDAWAVTINADSTETWTGTGGELKKTAMQLDLLRIDVVCADSAGPGDTMQFGVNYWIRLIEEE